MIIKKYHKFVRINHLISAILIIALVAIGFYMSGLKASDFKYDLYHYHKSFGMLVIILFIIRLSSRIITKDPEEIDHKYKIEIIAKKIIHFSLYFFMILMPISGYIMSSAKGYKVKLFFIELPNLIGKNEFLYNIAHETHEILPFIFLFILSFHIVAAFKYKESLKRISPL